MSRARDVADIHDGSTGITTLGTVTTGTINTTIGSSATFPAGGTGNPISVAIIADEKGSTTNAGTLILGGWRTRDLNTEISDPDGIVSIQSSTAGTQSDGSNIGNSFTLGAGTYLIEWSCPAFIVDRHQTKLYSITNSSDLARGSSEYVASSSSAVSRSFGAFVHTISASHTYEIRHYSGATRTPNGFGVDGQTGINSLYTIVKISKLK